MSATLKLTHKTIGAEVRRGRYDAVVDGKPAGSVELNETIDLPLEPGRHTLRVRVQQVDCAVDQQRAWSVAQPTRL
jgi:hypothetical protein